MAIVIGTNGNDLLLPRPPLPGTGQLMPTHGDDTIQALGGDDIVIGGRGDDTVDLGDGNDRFMWQFGDGYDAINGAAGTDTIEIDAAGQALRIDLYAGIDGNLRIEEPVDGALLAVEQVERVVIKADTAGGLVTIADLGGTGVQQVDVALGAAAEGQSVVVQGTAAGDNVSISGNQAAIRVDGFAAGIRLRGAEAHDVLSLRTGAGNDLVNLTGLAAGTIDVAVDAGEGDDLVVGHAGTDRIGGGKGIDLVQMGAGDDLYGWRVGEANDQVDGGAGTDTLNATATAGNDRFDLRGDAGAAVLSTALGVEKVRLSSVERLELTMLTGRDDVFLSGLDATAVKEVAIDLTEDGAGGLPDRVGMGASAADDSITLAAGPGGLVVQGMPWRATIAGLDADDQVTVAALDGNDRIDASQVGTAVRLRLDGGAGNDVITGSDARNHLVGGVGDDEVRGLRGDDLVQLGDGHDRALWQEGDGADVVNGGSGTDALVMTLGGTVADRLTVTAEGAKAVLTRQAANVRLETDSVELALVEAGAGNNRITVGDLAGTAMRIVQVTLDAGGGFVPQGKFDDVVSVTGTGGVDAVQLVKGAGGIEVLGLHAKTIVAGAEDGRDLLVIDTGAGNDSIDALALPAGNVALDILAGAGNDTITAHDGTDFVTGGTGDDNVRMGAGDDTYFWFAGDGLDQVKGDAGHDRVTVLTGATNDSFSLSAIGNQAVMTSGGLGNQVQSQGVEAFTILTGSGLDFITVGNQAASVVRDVVVNLGGDGVIDTAVADGTATADVVRVSGAAGSVVVEGLAAALRVDAADAIDRLTLRLFDGADTLDATQLADGTMDLTVSAGGGDDLLLGSVDADRLLGEAGDDTLVGNGGNDVLQGGAGADLFRFAPPDGTDRIEDFSAGTDHIQLLGFGTELDSFAEVAAVMAQVGTEVRIDLGANTDQGGLLILSNTTIGQLTAADFLFV